MNCILRQDSAADHPLCISTVFTVPEGAAPATTRLRTPLGRWSFRDSPQFDSVATKCCDDLRVVSDRILPLVQYREAVIAAESNSACQGQGRNQRELMTHTY